MRRPRVIISGDLAWLRGNFGGLGTCYENNVEVTRRPSEERDDPPSPGRREVVLMLPKSVAHRLRGLRDRWLATAGLLMKADRDRRLRGLSEGVGQRVSVARGRSIGHPAARATPLQAPYGSAPPLALTERRTLEKRGARKNLSGGTEGKCLVSVGFLRPE